MSGEVNRRLIGAAVSSRASLAGDFGLPLGLRGLDDRRIVGDPLLKKQIDGTDHRLGMEPPWHHVGKSVLARATRLIP